MCIFGWFKRRKKRTEEPTTTPENIEIAPVSEEKEPVKLADNSSAARREAEKSLSKSAKKSSPDIKTAEAQAETETDFADEQEIEAIADSLESSDVTPPATRGKGRFELNRTKDGSRYYFNIIASNKVGIATSQVYSSAQSAMIGIKSVIANAEKAPVEDTTLKKFEPLGYPKWEIYLDNAKQYRFRLDAPNGSCIVHSQGYTSKASCKNGIDSIIRNAKDALVDKAYLIKKDEEK